MQGVRTRDGKGRLHRRRQQKTSGLTSRKGCSQGVLDPRDPKDSKKGFQYFDFEWSSLENRGAFKGAKRSSRGSISINTFDGFLLAC